MTHEPATYTTSERTLGRLPSGADVAVTVHRYEGGDGPTVYAQAAQHGIELNGPATLRRLHEELLDAELAGTVVAVPLANRPAFDHRSYGAPPEFASGTAMTVPASSASSNSSCNRRSVAGPLSSIPCCAAWTYTVGPSPPS